MPVAKCVSLMSHIKLRCFCVVQCWHRSRPLRHGQEAAEPQGLVALCDTWTLESMAAGQGAGVARSQHGAARWQSSPVLDMRTLDERWRWTRHAAERGRAGGRGEGGVKCGSWQRAACWQPAAARRPASDWRLTAGRQPVASRWQGRRLTCTQTMSKKLGGIVPGLIRPGKFSPNFF